MTSPQGKRTGIPVIKEQEDDKRRIITIELYHCFQMSYLICNPCQDSEYVLEHFRQDLK
jgi:hypothetical protein